MSVKKLKYIDFHPAVASNIYLNSVLIFESVLGSLFMHGHMWNRGKMCVALFQACGYNDAHFHYDESSRTEQQCIDYFPFPLARDFFYEA